MPCTVLAKWIELHRCQATGPVLHSALCKIERQDLANQFEYELLGDADPLPDETATESHLPDHDTQVTDVSQLQPSLDILVEIAFSLPKLKHCIRLADLLMLGDAFVECVRDGAFTSDTAALNILIKWTAQNPRGATGRMLFDALAAIPQRHIAACFAGQLLGTEMDDWEEFCYNSEHREFFRLLRQRHIDIVATYECMHCSNTFLTRLYQWSVMSQSEFEDLLHSSRAEFRSATNKRLLELVNRKPRPLQQVFANLLCRYQPQLVDEEGSVLDPSQEVSGVDSMAIPTWLLEGQKLLDDFKADLRRWFGQLIITRPMDFVAYEDFQPVSEVYVTLSWISYADALRLIGAPQPLNSTELLRAGTRVDAESKYSKVLNLHSLLQYPQGPQAKSAIIFGSAGSGKSLTVLKILSEWWSQNKTSPFERFDVVIHITGRETSRIRTKSIQELWQLWRMGYTDHQQQFIVKHYSQHSEKVLFLVDAWDEAGDNGLLQEDTALKRILHGELFQYSPVIITSRPAPNTYLLLHKCKRRYSLVGFNNDRLKELFDRRLEEPHASQLFEGLSQANYAHVKSAVQKTPLFAAMLAHLYKLHGTLPGSITSLYQSMLGTICSRYVQWVKEMQANSHSEMLTFDENPALAEFQQVEKKLSELALEGWMAKKVTFTDKQVLCCSKTAIHPRFGLLSEVKEIKQSGCVLYHFNHLTFQEFLGAQCLAADPNFMKKLRVCVSSIGVGPHTRLFWQFTAGLIHTHLLPNLVYELAMQTQLSGLAPWETEFRLFLVSCIAEHIHVTQPSLTLLPLDAYLSIQPSCNLLPPDVYPYVQFAVQMVASGDSALALTSCFLDATNLSSLAIVMKTCPIIANLQLWNVRVDRCCPDLTSALQRLVSVELNNIVGQKAADLITTIACSLSRSAKLAGFYSCNTALTRGCLSAIARLINSSKSLKHLFFDFSNIGTSGMSYLNRLIRHTSSVSKLEIANDDVSGAGGSIGEMCSRMLQLNQLVVRKCCLGNADIAALLVGLQNSATIQVLNVEGNPLTNGVVLPVLQYAALREHLGAHLQATFQQSLPQMAILVDSDGISQEGCRLLARHFSSACKLLIITDNQVISSHISNVPVEKLLLDELERCEDGHFVHRHKISDQGAFLFAQMLSKDYACILRSVTLRNCRIGDNGAAAIATAMQKTPLEGLDLADNQIRFSGFYHIISTLANQNALKYLNLNKNPIFIELNVFQGQFTPSIFRICFFIRCLKVVALSSTGFNDSIDCFENSPLALLAIPSMSALDLSNNNITDHSIEMVIQWMHTLKYLSFSGNKISSAGAQRIIENIHLLTESGHCSLLRMWLGGNLVEESIFTDCNCDVISRESFCLEEISQRYVQSLFSSCPDYGSLPKKQSVEVRRGSKLSPIWIRMKGMVCSIVFHEYLEALLKQDDRALFDCWLMTACQALGQEDNSVGLKQKIVVLCSCFSKLATWYNMKERNVPMVVAALCCELCVINELMLAYSFPELNPSNLLLKLACLSLLGGEILTWIVQCLSGLAERCHRQQLHSLADTLLEQISIVMALRATSARTLVAEALYTSTL